MDETPSQYARRKRKITLLQKKGKRKSVPTVRENRSSLSSLSNENRLSNGSKTQVHIPIVRGSNRVPLSTLSNGKSYIIFCIDFSFCYLSLSKTHTVVLLFLKMQVLIIILQFPVVFISVATKGVQREQGPSCDPLHPLFLQL